MILNILPQHLNSYTLWLQNHQYQSNTIRNYQQDLKTYLSFSHNEVSEDSISKYFEVFSLKTNSSRYLASLSIFCQFLLDQHLTDTNLFRQTKKHLSRQPTFDLDKLLIQYQNFLIKDHKSDLTIKNYLNDIHQYFDWLKNNEIRN
jgi:site-specific recombinase XerD